MEEDYGSNLLMAASDPAVTWRPRAAACAGSFTWSQIKTSSHTELSLFRCTSKAPKFNWLPVVFPTSQRNTVGVSRPFSRDGAVSSVGLLSFCRLRRRKSQRGQSDSPRANGPGTGCTHRPLLWKWGTVVGIHQPPAPGKKVEVSFQAARGGG